MFEEAFPDRFINVGIAEQCLVDVAVGFAYCGKIPFANTFAFLLATRALEMVRTHLCYGNANVKLMGAYAGLSDSFDGPTHHSVMDIAAMRSLPNMTVVVPSDPLSIGKFLFQAAAYEGPMYIRLNRNEVPVLFDDKYDPEIGKAVVHCEGSDVTLICAGIMVSRCLEAAKALEHEGIKAGVLEVHTIKPLDEERIYNAAQESGAIVTAEEHSVIGGLGSAVAEFISEAYPVPMKRVGIPDTFAETGPYLEILNRFGMSTASIVSAAKAAISMK
jgi:transketolase